MAPILFEHALLYFRYRLDCSLVFWLPMDSTDIARRLGRPMITGSTNFINHTLQVDVFSLGATTPIPAALQIE